ncbi:MAG: hypothetical protein H7A46_21240 [Verrucomicrobiales bacterium]|nr:hypothetical protein [Verrucomicrobiales bacterium]
MPADSVVWAENGVGKSSLLTLFFSTYQTNRRMFLGARGVAKARELSDYVHERDLSFIITEWDITDDRSSPALLADEPRELLVVGQMLSWKSLDRSTGELRRRFFSFRPIREVTFEDLPVAGLAEPVNSYEAFLDWLNSKAKAYPKLQVVHESNQGDWRAHLESCHLDPELFAYQLRMNLDEGGVNELFNELRENKDFIRLFLELGLDPETPSKVRSNLSDFLPQHRRLEAMRTQVAFNERLLVELGLFLEQLALVREVDSNVRAASEAASTMLAQLHVATHQAAAELEQLKELAKELEGRERGVKTQRDSVRRRLNFFTRRRAELEVSEAQSAVQAADREVDATDHTARLVSLAESMSELRDHEAEASVLQETIRREQEQARPELEAIEALGAHLKKALGLELAQAKSHLSRAQEQRRNLRNQQTDLQNRRLQVGRDQAAKTTEYAAVEQFFTNRDRQRDKLRQDHVLESKEEASTALARWQSAAQEAAAAATRNRNERDTAIADGQQLAEQRATLLSQASEREARFNQLNDRITVAEKNEAAIASHPELQAAVETAQADIELPATLDRLRQRSSDLLNHLLRLNADMAEDDRAEQYVERDGLFPPTRDVEAVVEHLKTQGLTSVIPATHWLASNTDADTANALLTSDPARYHGVMFNSLVDQAKAEAAVKFARSPHAPVQVSPTPEQMPSPTASPALVVPPCHAGAFNREAAQAERVDLQARLHQTRTQLDQLRAQQKACTGVETKLSAWLAEFGGGKLTTLREQRRGEEQSLASLRQRAKEAGEQSTARHMLAHALETKVRQHDEAAQHANSMATKLESFIEQFESPLEDRRQEREALKQRLAELEAQLGTLQDTIEQLGLSEPRLEGEEQAARDAVRDVEAELRTITYVAAAQPNAVTEALAALRQSYAAEVQRFEGRFKNTAAQGRLEEKQGRIAKLKQSLSGEEFRGLLREDAEALLDTGDLRTLRSETKERHGKALAAKGAAELMVKQARKALEDLGTLGDLDRPLKGEILPETASGVGTIVAELEAEAKQLEAEHERVRLGIEVNNKAAQAATSRCDLLKSRSKLLTNLDVPPSSRTDLPPMALDDASIEPEVDELCSKLRDARTRAEQQHEMVAERHAAIRELTQSDAFPHGASIPARSLFATITLPEMLQGEVAVERQAAVSEQTETLKAELRQMQQHRELIVNELLTEAEKAVRLLGRAARYSKMPATMTGWEDESFLRIHLSVPHSQDEKLLRLRGYVDDLLARGTLPDGVRLVFDALLSLVTERGMEASILKPETQRRKARYPVREMSGWSEGERTTVAIILYCTLVKLRAQSRGQAERRAEVSALLLDNPIGKASKPEFLEMHRWIAGALGVQLIYATGINDPQALGIFPNRIRLAKNRFVPETGDLAVGVVGEEAQSVIHSIRIFDGHADANPDAVPSTEA